MKKVKTEKQKERDKKGKERIAKYEQRQEADEPEISPDSKTTTFFQKKQDGDWEKLEYIHK